MPPAAAPLPEPAHWKPKGDVPLLDCTLGQLLRRTAEQHPERPALAWAEDGAIVAMAYRQFLAEAEQVAFWLLEHGRVGDRVAPWSRNSVEWALLEFGCALAGMVVASWNPGWTDFECRHALELTEPVLVLAGEDTRGNSLLARAVSLAGSERVFLLGDLRRLAAPVAATDLPSPSPDDLCLIQFTSGTTGKAKGASLSHRCVVNAAWLRAAITGADETDVWVNPSPLNHMGGAVTMLPGAVSVGGCYVVMDRFDAGEYLRLMHDCHATRIGGVPTMLLGLLEHPGWQPGSARLRAVGAGGAQVPQALIERLQLEFAAPVLVSYAQSESPIITSSAPDDPSQLLAETVGRCAPHVELKIVDPASGRLCRTGETGEVCVRSPMVMQGYFRAPEATAAAFDADGFLRTGDLGSLDAQGYVRISGRSRDVIIRGGENIYPAEVEDALLKHAALAQVAVVGVPDAKWGQQVAAAVQLREGCQASTAELEAHAAERLARFKVPRMWRFVDSFPQTPNGKIAKLEVEKIMAHQALGASGEADA